MIATIAVIAEKKNFSDDMETTLQRWQQQRSLRKNFLYLSDCCRFDRWRVVSYDRGCDHSDGRDHYENRLI